MVLARHLQPIFCLLKKRGIQMENKRNGFNVLGFIVMSLVLGFLFLSFNPTVGERGQKGQLLLQIEEILEQEAFILKGDVRSAFVEYLVETAREYEFDPLLILAIMKIESAFKPMAVSFSGAYGLLQIKPIAAEEVAQAYAGPRIFDYQLFDPFINVRIGVQYLSYLRDTLGPDKVRVLSAYNLGPTLVKRCRGHSTRYAKKVLRAYQSFLSQIASV